MVRSAIELSAILARHGINPDRPGFYDTAEFLAAEARDPYFLQLYNEYVTAREYDRQYLDQARERINRLAEFMARELGVDGRLGACVDASGVAMRILEREGIWCCMFKGGVRIDYPPDANLRPQFFHPLMHPNNPAVAGHAWLFAPPFAVADFTLGRQPYRQEEQRRLVPTFVLVDNPERGRPATLTELAEPELLELHANNLRRRPTFDDVVPHAVRQILDDYPPVRTTVGNVTLKYFAVAITAPDLPLDEMSNLCLSGRYPRDLARAFAAEFPSQ